MPKASYIDATDMFCGAGGTSEGLVGAGVEVRMALNHWELAIETHNTNHPNTDHDCRDVQATDPRRYPRTHILTASPECTNHSLAKGKKRKSQGQHNLFGGNEIDPASERSRATMWDVVRFAEYHDYETIIVENVVDVRYWRLWDAWLKAMHNLGYNHKCKYLNSRFFFPCPQSRDRIYIVFWKKGNRAPDLEHRPLAPCRTCGEKEAYQSWKRADKKWGKYGKNGQYWYRCSGCNEEVTPYYYAAFNAIDWSIPGRRIGDNNLAKKTLERIQYGLDTFGKQTMIIRSNATSGVSCRVRTCQDTLQTFTATRHHYLLNPFMINLEHSKIHPKHRVTSSGESLNTQTTTNATGFVLPFMMEMNRTGKARKISEYLSTILAGGNHHMLVANYTPGYTRSLDKPLGTITTQDHHGLVSAPFMVENHGNSKSKPITEPMGAITTITTHGIVTPASLNSFLSYYYSGSYQNTSVLDPLSTLTTNDRASVITSAPNIEDCYYRMLKPHEVKAGMAFRHDYIILGNARQKVKQAGNAVTPPVMAWLANRCVKALEE